MLSTNNPWQLLREQLLHIEDTSIPTAPMNKSDSSQDDHWMEFEADVCLPSHAVGLDLINQSVVLTHVCKDHESLRLFDIVLTFNGIDLRNIDRTTAQYVFDAHRGKRVSVRLRRLQPMCIETIEFQIKKKGLLDSNKLGFTIEGGIGKSATIDNDPGLFIIGLSPRSRAAKHGRLRIGDRLLQLSNAHTTVNFQCMKLDKALELIARMKKESTSLQLLVAHRTQH